MAHLKDMTTPYLEELLVLNPLASGQTKYTQSFPLTLILDGQQFPMPGEAVPNTVLTAVPASGKLVTPIFRYMILNELANRQAADVQNPTNPATSYGGVIETDQPTTNSNGSLLPLGAVSPVGANVGPTPAQNNANTNLGGSSVQPVQGNVDPVPVVRFIK